ncbi:MAG TPA: hypothetical protein VGD11_07205 [Mycobacteriales bacterium]|jgi:hypothetical protein|nr:hypothetical protein [Mycobacterium sp.]
MADPGYPQAGQPPGRVEAFPNVTKTNRPVYLAVIWILGATLVIGVVGWIVLSFTDRRMPDGLGVVIGTVAGGLVGLISGKTD